LLNFRKNKDYTKKNMSSFSKLPCRRKTCDCTKKVGDSIWCGCLIDVKTGSSSGGSSGNVQVTTSGRTSGNGGSLLVSLGESNSGPGGSISLSAGNSVTSVAEVVQLVVSFF
jgi:hypothetical protein